MIRVKDIVRAPKEAVDSGKWKPCPNPGTAFPLTRSGNRTLKFGAGYSWRLVRFTSKGASYRLLIIVNFSKQNFYAHLGQELGGDMRMLASYEFHASHGGWHTHAGCGDVEDIPGGRYKGDWKRMIPKDVDACRQIAWGLNDEDAAFVKACNRFGIAHGQGGPIQTEFPL